MKKKVTPRDVIIYTLCISVILLTLIDSTYKLVGIKYDFWLTTGIVVGIILYVFLIHRIKFTWISILLIFLIPKPLYIIGFFKAFILGLNDFIKSVIENEYILEKYFNYFNNIVFIVLPVLIIIFYIMVVVKKQAVVLILFGGTLISIYYFIGLDNLLGNCNIFLIASFILYSYNNYSIMWSKWDYRNIKLGRFYFLRVIGFNLLLILLVNFAVSALPTNRDPISLNWFETNILNRFENIQGEDAVLSDSSYKSKFSLSYTGFQQDARRLGGPVKDNYSLALRVKSRDNIGGIHLRGTIKDLYSGFMWDKSDNKTTKFKNELKVDEYNMEFQFKEMEIVHEGLKTTTAFNALYPYMLTNSYNYGFIDSDLETFNPRVIKPGKSYTVKFKEYFINQETILEKSPDKTERLSNTFFDKYLKLPAGIPKRVYDLADEITNKYSSPYMKASAIENYLKTNFPYSKDTSILPEGRDFVDYFLFDEKKGSCSYYATALAVMARMVDIPSRYVEGFVVPNAQNSDGYRDILNSDAHAWVELYLEGVGWVTFDPTPGNSSSAYQFEQENKNNNQAETNDTAPNGNTNINRDDKKNNGKLLDETDEGAVSTQTGTSWVRNALYVFVGVMLFGLLLFGVSIIAYMSINILIRKNKRIIDFSKHKMLLYGNLTYIPYEGGETLREYLQVLSGRLKIDLDKYILIYEKALYAKHNITSKEQEEIIDIMLEVRKKTMEYYGKMGFYWYDYIDTLKFYIRINKKSK